jgi:putative Mn2+ efflux pump MntP
MVYDFQFFCTAILLGVGLAMDAFSVSLANGLNDHGMRAGKACGIAGLFALFQALMPLLGWICIHTVVQYFHSFEKFIPWIALILLAYIGGKMLWDGIKNRDCGEAEVPKLGFGALIVQGIATSIDALSVGFTIADYDLPAALIAAVVIALVTFIICLCGVLIGKKMGTCLAGKASIFGGVILIGIGIWIFVKGFFGF